jgi:predicted DNA-binding transcriptional regulator YafY
MRKRKPSARPRGRHHEILRQWHILRTLYESRHGKTLRPLAEQGETSERTMRRDLGVLTDAGFHVVSEKVDGETRWKLDRAAFKELIRGGFTLPELCALYFSRTLIESLAGTPFHADLARAFDRIEETLPPRLWTYLEQLPAILVSKPEPPKKHGDRTAAVISRLTQAMLEHRTIEMRYHSFSSRSVKTYRAEPHRMAYGQGGLYLHAFVPIYGELRTFAVERIQEVSVLEEHFTPHRLTEEPFADSLGVYTGRPEPVELEFTRKMAPYVAERAWHRSQQLAPQPDGSVRVKLLVTVDWALRNWVLSFGGDARVIAPKRLAEEILEALEEARAQYAPKLAFELEAVPRASGDQRRLFRAR